MTAPFDLYLASASPRRRELLEQLGISYRLIADLNIDETLLPGEAPDEYVMRLACDKARAGMQAVKEQGLPDAAVLGADTCISLDGQILGKPEGREQAVAMLEALSGRSHEVLTAICLMRGQDVQPALSRSTVTFAKLTADQINSYWQTGEPADKAGGYAIQGHAARYISRLEGSYSGVVGLPLYELSQLLR